MHAKLAEMKSLQTHHTYIPVRSKQHAPINNPLIGIQQPPKPWAEPSESQQPLELTNQRADISQQGSNWPDPTTSRALHQGCIESKPATMRHTHAAN